MTIRAMVPFAVLSPLLAIACDPAQSLPCDVTEVLEKKCQQCHSNPPRFGAPMPLVTFNDLHAASVIDPSQQVYQRVLARIHDAAAPMPPPSTGGLDPAEMATLDGWLKAGAPQTAGCAVKGGSTGNGANAGDDCTSGPKIKLRPPGPIEIPAGDDSLICYQVDVPLSAPRHVTALAPKVGDDKLVHHMTLFLAETAPLHGPSWDCTSTPNGEPGWRPMTIWAPGAQDLRLPPEAGFPAVGTMHYVVQVHYENLGHVAHHEDTSGFDLCSTETLRPYDADMLVFGTELFSIPAHGKLDTTCTYDIGPELASRTVVAALPHMHRMGGRISTTVVSAGEQKDLGSRVPYSYDYQSWTEFAPGVALMAGDHVETRCAWDNPSGQDVHFGESVNDEMCSSFSIYYPKVVAQGWKGWETPAKESKCVPSP
jgi:hypothetical protein